MLRVTVTEYGPGESVCHLELEVPNPSDPNALPEHKYVDCSDVDLLNEQAFTKTAFVNTRWVPQFIQGQRGRNFSQFTEAVSRMIEEVRKAPLEASEAGFVAAVTMSFLKPMLDRPMPASRGEVSMLGWMHHDEYFLRFGELTKRLRAQIHPLKGPTILKGLNLLGVCSHELYTYPDGEAEMLVRLSPRQARPRLRIVPPALPPPSA